MVARLLASLALAMTLATAGAPQAPAPLSAAQQAKITQEVLKVAKVVLASAERLDLEGILKTCQDGPDFAFVQPDGQAYTFAETRKVAGEAFGALASQTMATRREKVVVLSADAALYLWQGRNDLIQKDRVVLRSDPYACTYLFRKVQGHWRFVYGHESGLPYAPVKEGPASEK